MIKQSTAWYYLSKKIQLNYLLQIHLHFSYDDQGNLREALWSTGDVSNLSSEVNKSTTVNRYGVPDRTETISIVSREDDRWRETISQGTVG